MWVWILRQDGSLEAEVSHSVREGAKVLMGLRGEVWKKRDLLLEQNGDFLGDCYTNCSV